MSLNLNETFRVSAPPDRVWRFLKNPADVVTCLPGAELTETIDDKTYGGRVKVKVGPITAKYAGTATLAEVDDDARKMQILAEGKETGGAGSARMTLNGSVVALPDGTSEVTVDAAIDIAGRVMQFGRGLIESVNKQLFRQFSASVQAKMEAAEGGAEGDAEDDAPPPADRRASGGDDTSAGPGVGSGGAAPAPRADSTAPRPATPPPATAASPARGAATPSRAPIAQGEELRALPLLWKAFLSWLAGLFGRNR